MTELEKVKNSHLVRYLTGVQRPGNARYLCPQRQKKRPLVASDDTFAIFALRRVTIAKGTICHTRVDRDNDTTPGNIRNLILNTRFGA